MSRRFLLIPLLMALATGAASAFPGDEQETRFGKLAVTEENLLKFNGKLVLPGIRGNNSLSFENTFRVGETDVVLLQNSGGSGCPAMFIVLAVSRSGVAQSPEFGTCSDLIRTSLEGDILTLTQPRFHGKGSARYVFSKGKLTENGKPVR